MIRVGICRNMQKGEFRGQGLHREIRLLIVMEQKYHGLPK